MANRRWMLLLLGWTSLITYIDIHNNGPRKMVVSVPIFRSSNIKKSTILYSK